MLRALLPVAAVLLLLLLASQSHAQVPPVLGAVFFFGLLVSLGVYELILATIWVVRRFRTPPRA